jgi:hypothetical protein
VWGWIRAFGVVLGVGCAGCSIHPLPEDVARVNSFDIVRQIRCETRDTLRQVVIGWLEILAQHGSVRAQQLALQYRNDPASIREFHYDLFNTPDLVQVRSTAKLFYDTGIAYNFDLTGTEDNDVTVDLNFLKDRVFTKLSLALNAEAKRQRSNIRSFTVTDTFSGLFRILTEKFCEGQVVGPNYIYPISGRIGVDKLVNDFIYLTLFGHLSSAGVKASDAATAGGAVGLPYMVDEMQFTTIVKASANPKIEFTPVTPAFQLLNAEADVLARRTDIHKVTVGLAIAPSGQVELAPLRAYLFGSGSASARGPVASSSGLVVGTRVIGGGTPSEKLAVLAVDQLKSREIQLIPPL